MARIGLDMIVYWCFYCTEVMYICPLKNKLPTYKSWLHDTRSILSLMIYAYYRVSSGAH